MSRIVTKSFFLVFLLSFSSTAFAAAPEGLFSDVQGLGRSTGSYDRDDATVIRSRTVRVNMGEMTSSASSMRTADGSSGENSVLLNLFDDATFYAALKSRRQSSSGKSVVWSGAIEGMGGNGRVTLVVSGNIVSGHVSTDNGDFYEIRYTGDGTHRVLEIDQNQFADTDVISVDVPKTSPLTSRIGGSEEEDVSIEADPGDDGSLIDIMVLYTRSARMAAGGVEAMENLIDLAIAVTNQGYEESGVIHRIRVVHSEEVDYDERGGYLKTLEDLRKKTDGALDYIHSLRDRYGADMVSIIINNREYCGLAYQMETASYGFDRYAFSAVHYSCAAGNYSFAHEIGHNMGAAHDRDSFDGSPIFEYAYGFRQTGANQRFYTVMAYPCTGCVKINRWSNPQVQYNGWDTGVDNIADNHRTLNDTRVTVANWRLTKVEIVTEADEFAEEMLERMK